MEPEQEENLRRTYFALRLGLVVLALLLAIAIVIALVAFGCLQSSISAYYYTPVRPVFVASLCAIGAGLVIYRGSSSAENALLDVAGFLAFVIAFVPVRFPQDDEGCRAVDVPDIALAVANNMLALILAGGVALALTRAISRPSRGMRRSSAIALVICVVLWAAFAALFLLDRPLFLRVAHGLSAIVFFGLILAVILLNARASDSPGFRRTYLATFVGSLLLAALVGVVWWVTGLRTTVFWLEAVGIVGFIVFWAAQTLELRDDVDRAHRRTRLAGPTG